MKVTSPPDVANLPMYPFRYSRSRHSTSNVTCRLAIRECSPCPRFYGIPTQAACRFEVEDLARDGAAKQKWRHLWNRKRGPFAVKPTSAAGAREPSSTIASKLGHPAHWSYGSLIGRSICRCRADSASL